jgi:UDP-3-O-[3-hydroxymyristoyl] glucosamine N-acyltransferase
MAKVIIFGVQDFAQLAKFYLQHDSEHEVAAFSVHEAYVPEGKTFEGLPVVAFENVEQTYPPSEFKFFAPMSPSRMNKLRESIYHQIKDKGYEMISYVSSKATVFPGATIGDNCFILEDNTIQPFTSIGNNVVLWSGNHIGHHSVIKDHVSFTSHVVLSGHCVVESCGVFGLKSKVGARIKKTAGSLKAVAPAVTN